MSSTLYGDAARSNLRACVASVERALSQTPPGPALCAAWDDLVKVLALGPDPLLAITTGDRFVVQAVRGGQGRVRLQHRVRPVPGSGDTGVVDSTKVVRVALQNAASVASLKLTTEARIAEWPKHGTTTSDKENS